MVLESQPVPYLEWLVGSSRIPGALVIWLAVAAALLLGCLLASFIATAARHGPARAGDIIFQVLRSAASDILHTSPRRVFALARLAVQEALRRRVIAGFIAFVVILLFAGWFLNPSTTNPTQLYLDFVLTATSGLVLVLAILLSAFSLPNDIQSRTIFTVVTKPVRPTEIVLGRMLGFSAIGTVLLAVMGTIGYFFVVRTLDHTHQLAEADLAPVSAEGGATSGLAMQGRTGESREHRHDAHLDADGRGRSEVARHHWHPIERDARGSYRVGSPQGQFNARVPVYGKLSFKNRDGNDANTGLNVGNEWTYRSYVEGATPAAAIWKFEGLRPEDYPQGLPLEMTIRVFRTYKGEIGKGVLGSITLRNPGKPHLSSNFRTFVAKEYAIDRHLIPLKFQDDTGRTLDLFRDLVHDGQLEIQLKCLEHAQFFGMAQPDVYLLHRQAPFWVNYVKGHVGSWLQMLLITAFGVMWSTFLNGPVALLATLATMGGGYFGKFMQDLAANKVLGGGTFESLIRIVGQDNLTSRLEENVTTTVATWLDQLMRAPLFVISHVVPDLPRLSDIAYVANGYDIPPGLLGTHLTMAFAFIVPVLLAGFLFFKVREVAK